MNSPLVYIILLNYNGYKDTIECCDSLSKITYDNYKIIIVDNNSTNDSEKILRERLNACHIMQTGKNLGFAGGNNYGIKYALEQKADYILLLNNDTIVESDFLDTMINAFCNNPNVGIVGCKINYFKEKNVIWYGGGNVNWFKFVGVHEHEKERDDEKIENVQREVTFISGCTMLIKNEVFDKVGLLPEEYFMYMEDLDFCILVKDKGYKLIYEPKALIYHNVSLSTGGEYSPFSIQWGTRNRIIFMDKYKYKVSKAGYLSSILFFYSTRLMKLLGYLINGNKVKAKALMNGLKEGKNFLKNK